MSSTISITSSLGAMDAFRNVVASLVNSIATTSWQLTGPVDPVSLAEQLGAYASSVEPLVAALTPVAQRQLLANSTFVAQNLAGLTEVVNLLPARERNLLSKESLVELITFSATPWTIDQLFTPDAWAIFLMFFLAVTYRISMAYLASPTRRRRVLEIATVRTSCKLEAQAMEKETFVVGPEHDLALAKGVNKATEDFERRSQGFVAHTANFIISTICLILQLIAYRLFEPEGLDVRSRDLKILLGTGKILLCGYVGELIFVGGAHGYIFAHHFFTWALFFVAEVVNFHVHTLYFFRVGQWILLQATIEQATYVSMMAYHLSQWLHLQDSRTGLQKQLIRIAWRLSEFNKWWSIPQKYVPAAMSAYFVARSWKSIEHEPISKFWIVWYSMLLTLLVLMQTYFCDANFAIAAHLRSKVTGEPSKSREGPLINFLRRVTGRRSRTSNARDLVTIAPTPLSGASTPGVMELPMQFDASIHRNGSNSGFVTPMSVAALSRVTLPDSEESPSSRTSIEGEREKKGAEQV